ncbi:MAG: hypothetical protein AAF483_05395 [Planctomycetota bacterium]
MNPWKATNSTALVLGMIIFAMSGCNLRPVDNPGEWAVERVTTKMEERCEATEVELTKTAEGFEGTGKRADGETLKIEVTQDAEAQRLDWKVTGDRGFFDEGFRENIKPGEDKPGE